MSLLEYRIRIVVLEKKNSTLRTKAFSQYCAAKKYLFSLLLSIKIYIIIPNTVLVIFFNYSEFIPKISFGIPENFLEAIFPNMKMFNIMIPL